MFGTLPSVQSGYPSWLRWLSLGEDCELLQIHLLSKSLEYDFFTDSVSTTLWVEPFGTFFDRAHQLACNIGNFVKFLLKVRTYQNMTEPKKWPLSWCCWLYIFLVDLQWLQTYLSTAELCKKATHSAAIALVAKLCICYCVLSKE